MADAITPVPVAALPFPIVQPVGRTWKKRSRGIRIGLVASEMLSLTALALIVVPLAGQLRWFDASRLLAGWPDLRDAHAICQQFVRQSESPRNPTRSEATQKGAWSWVRLDDGRFRIVGDVEGRTRSGNLRRSRYQCDLVPLTSNGRWRVDRLVVSHEPPS